MAPPEWIEGLRERVAGAFHCPEQAVVQARWHDEDDGEEPHWEVVAYPSLREIVGGRHDGERIYPRLLAEVDALRRMFDEVLGVTLDGGCIPLIPAALNLWGLYRGERVQVRILLAPPKDAEPMDLLDAFTGENKPR